MIRFDHIPHDQAEKIPTENLNNDPSCSRLVPGGCHGDPAFVASLERARGGHASSTRPGAADSGHPWPQSPPHRALTEIGGHERDESREPRDFSCEGMRPNATVWRLVMESMIETKVNTVLRLNRVSLMSAALGGPSTYFESQHACSAS